jgi:uncharacterized membrane protein YsdA (DUF1294 family)
MVALAVLIGFGVFVWFMIDQRAADETSWARLAWLFASVEAVAFAAAGALFGVRVQREQTQRAEERADRSQTDAENGRILAEIVKMDGGSATVDTGLEALGASGSVDTAARHAAVARRLFPDE